MLVVNLWPSHYYNCESFDCLAKIVWQINQDSSHDQWENYSPIVLYLFDFFEKCLFWKQFPQISLLECVFLNILTFFAHSTQSIQSLPNSIKVLWIFPLIILQRFLLSLFNTENTLTNNYGINWKYVEGFQVKNQVKTILEKTRKIHLKRVWNQQHCNTKWKSRVLQMKKWR